MAAGMYTNGLQEIMAGNIDLINDDIVGLLVDTTVYTVDTETDDTQADIPAEAILSESSITGNTLIGSTFKADDLVFKNVTGAAVGALVIIKDSGVYNTSTLIAYTDNSVGFPVVPSGEDITIHWSTGPEGIFTL